MSAVRFEYQGDHYAVSFRYDATVVDVIKSLPWDARRWDQGSRVWRVEVSYAQPLAGHLRELGYLVVGLDAPRQATADGDWARVLFRRVGRMRSEPVFRALTRVLHPDAGGDTALMTELNRARDELMGG